MMNIFKPRTAVKPFEYPEVIRYRRAINQSRWDVEEFNLESDAFQFQHELDEAEQSLVKRALLSISQVEVGVKSFWGDLFKHLPKAEFAIVGSTFSENEVVHFEAYQKLIEVLGLESEFEEVLKVPAIAGRVDYLTKYLNKSSAGVKERFSLHIALFGLFIENTSLFAQFAIPKSVYNSRNMLKEIDSIIDATMKEELIHANFATHLVKLIRDENPDWFGPDFEEKIKDACLKSFEAECNIIDWMFEKGDLPYLSKDNIIEFVKYRFNDSLEGLGITPIFELNDALLAPLQWMIESIYAYMRNDFFDTQSTNYTKFARSVSRKDLF